MMNVQMFIKLDGAEQLEIAEQMYEAIRDLLEIGKRDLCNPKYDGYFDALRAARDKAEGKE